MNKLITYITSLILLIIISSCNKEQKVPFTTHFWAVNSFSPNGDFINEVYYIQPHADIHVPEFHISMYDQNLQLVFYSDDINTGWDGKLHGSEMPPGYYEFQIVYQASQPLDSNSTDTIYSDYITTSKVNLFR